MKFGTFRTKITAHDRCQIRLNLKDVAIIKKGFSRRKLCLLIKEIAKIKNKQ